MLPGPIQIAVMGNGTLYVDTNSIIDSRSIVNAKMLEKYNNMPMTILPAPGGKMYAVPLFNNSIGDYPGMLNTAVTAIELYLQANSEADSAERKRITDKILEATSRHGRIGMDISTSEGLKRFINTYFTYTQRFTAADTLASPSDVEGPAESSWMLDIVDDAGEDSKGGVMVGMRFSGSSPKMIQLGTDGKLTPESRGILESLLGERFVGVQFKNEVEDLLNTDRRDRKSVV